MKQIVCLSTANFHPFPTRKQNVMKRLQDVEILYFDPPVTYLAPLRDRKLLPRLSDYKKQGQKAAENITVYATPPVLPFFNRYRLINRLNQKRLSAFINRKLESHGFSKPLLWCYSPTSCDIADSIPHCGVVYDCVDRHSAYGGLSDPAAVDKMEEDLAASADVVFSTAEGLHERLSRFNEHAYMIPNGADYGLFSKAHEALPLPEELKGVTKPVFGFVGMLQQCIDTDILKKVAQSFPGGTLAVCGKALPGVDISALEELPNVRLCGLVPHGELPRYLSNFDVCLNPFRPGGLSRHVSPLKFYEYLATGKPVVSTPEPLQVLDYSDAVYIASDADEFVAKCGEAARENDPDAVLRRMEYGRRASWDAKVREMERILSERIVFKG